MKRAALVLAVALAVAAAAIAAQAPEESVQVEVAVDRETGMATLPFATLMAIFRAHNRNVDELRKFKSGAGCT